VIIIAGLLVLLLLVAAAGVGYFVFKRRSATPTLAWSDADAPIPVTSNDPAWGDRTAVVTLVIFGDYEDPDTASLMTTVKTLEATYNPAQLRVVWKHLPLATHPNARAAAETAAGLYALKGNATFWHFTDRALGNQSSLSQASYDTWASEAGADTKKLARAAATTKVDDDERLGHTLGAFSTPMSFVNGIQVVGAEPIATWRHVIDDELTRAHVVAASGVSADRLYVTRAKDNMGTRATPPLVATTTTLTAAPTGTPAPTATALTPTTVHNVPIGGSPARGPRDALVTIVEFSDFQCPYCKKAEATLTALRGKYGPDLRIVWKNEPLAFHVRAVPAAELALEARDEHGDVTFWAVHDELYASSPTLDDATLMRIARDNGVSEVRSQSAITMNLHKSMIDTDQALATKLSATGTPTFFINGHTLTGAQPQSRFEEVIDDELLKARVRVASGTARAKVYDAIMSEATD
jgi:protein-disulfide isomerase